jgi:hypothetical protein
LWISLMVRCTWYNITWLSLSMTCDCRWFSLGTPAFSTNKTDRHDLLQLSPPIKLTATIWLKCCLKLC